MAAKSLQIPTDALPPQKAARFAAALLGWYRRSHRKLPWRGAGGRGAADPYHVLLSETMLQQTQVATVVDYFNRFLAAFPTLADLAAASEQEVLKCWQGLGYYRRARNLHAAARHVMQQCGGKMPGTIEELIKLPGVGRYTAGAIASIGFGRREPVVDGNVARVYCRLLVINDPVGEPATMKRLWEAAGEMMPAGRAGRRQGDFNQGLMELGATICKPRQPTCGQCPVRDFCGAHKQGLTEKLPVAAQRAKPRSVRHDVVAIQNGGRIYFQQRPDRGLWAGMWQMPTREGAPRETKATEAQLRAWISGIIGPVGELNSVGGFEHQTTHRRIEFRLWLGKLKGRRSSDESAMGRWLKPSDAGQLPFSNAQKRAIAAILAHLST